MTSGEGRASGKVILLGEHAVVYGVAGLAAGIDRGARANARDSTDTARLTLVGPEGTRTQITHLEDGDLPRAFAALLGPDTERPVAVEAVAEVPPGGGLGCSAALGVAIARAREARRATGDSALDARVLARATAWERVFHGNPSGIDTAAAMQGAALRFVRGEAPTVLANEHDVWLAVAYSGRGASTRAMVEHVAGLRVSRPTTIERFLARVEALVDSATASLRSGHADALGRSMTENHALLAELELSTPAIERLLEVAHAQGALGAKLTGSGGGGSVIALGGLATTGATGSDAEARANSIAHAWARLGHPAFATRIAGRPRSEP